MHIHMNLQLIFEQYLHFQYAHIVSFLFGPSVGVDRGNVVVHDDAGDMVDDDDKEDAGCAYRQR